MKHLYFILITGLTHGLTTISLNIEPWSDKSWILSFLIAAVLSPIYYRLEEFTRTKKD